MILYIVTKSPLKPGLKGSTQTFHNYREANTNFMKICAELGYEYKPGKEVNSEREFIGPDYKITLIIEEEEEES